METKDILLALRTKNGLSQDALAQKCFVTRQAVSRWETGETLPNTETLKRLSQLYNVSINTLLGAPRTLICQCCGMPLDDAYHNQPRTQRHLQRRLLHMVLQQWHLYLQQHRRPARLSRPTHDYRHLDSRPSPHLLRKPAANPKTLAKYRIISTQKTANRSQRSVGCLLI